MPRLLAMGGVVAIAVGVAVLARLVWAQGWLWFIAAPLQAAAVSGWLALAGVLTQWSRGHCHGHWKLLATTGLALMAAALAACVVLLVGGSASLIHQLVTSGV